MTQLPLVYIIIVTWNHCADTVECLSSLARSTYSHLQCLIVDNGSTDATLSIVREAFPRTGTIEMGANRGFAAAVNAGIRRALREGADHVLLLNNDTLVDREMIERLVVHARPDIALVAPLVYYASPDDMIWTAGGLCSRWTLEQRGDLRGQRDGGGWPAEVARDFIPACAALISRQALASVGLFDERFFMYYEDFDWCRRARQTGWGILLVPHAHVWHKVSRSSGGKDAPAERYAMARASVQFFRKHVHGGRWLVVGPYRLGSALKTTARLLASRQMPSVRAYWRGLHDGWLAQQHPDRQVSCVS